MVVSEIFDSFKNRLFSFIDTILIIGLIWLKWLIASELRQYQSPKDPINASGANNTNYNF
jgi:hypothetical protein